MNNKYLKYKQKYLELKSTHDINMFGSGLIDTIPRDLLQFISSAEIPEERIAREKINPYEGPYHIFDNIEELTQYYINPDSDKYQNVLKLFNAKLSSIFNPIYATQIINSRGNGLCAYNSLYMYLKLTDKQEIIRIITGGSDKFEDFHRALNRFTKDILLLDRHIYGDLYDETLRGLDDENAPYVEPIFKTFNKITGINILLIDATKQRDSQYNFTIYNFKVEDEIPDETPWDYIMLLKTAAHIMLIHSHGEFSSRKEMYENFK